MPKKSKIVCSTCGAPFHGLTPCKPKRKTKPVVEITTFEALCARTNWPLLRQQKECLIRTIGAMETSPRPIDVSQTARTKERGLLEGLLGFIDSIQDLAADHYGTDVFAKQVVLRDDPAGEVFTVVRVVSDVTVVTDADERTLRYDSALLEQYTGGFCIVGHPLAIGSAVFCDNEACSCRDNCSCEDSGWHGQIHGSACLYAGKKRDQ